MQLSIIIVSYNVKYFLEQCLCSVKRAAVGLAVEVIVVDNASSDGSLAYLNPLFPEVTFVANDTNQGFAKACNIGLNKAKGSRILFLNPDVLLAEDTLQICLQFADLNPDAGALGVKMVDGSGSFLKESKRGFPAPVTSFFKLAGFPKLFPRSRFFSRYYLGHLPDHQTSEVDVLAGAFMLIPKQVLEQVGSFDEAFFMYGEDIDLSYRIQQAGYRNYYVADTTIIHFKGESTQKESLHYVRVFYAAMSIFVRKHYRGAGAGAFYLLLQLAIRGRAAISAAAKGWGKISKRRKQILEKSSHTESDLSFAIAASLDEYRCLQLLLQQRGHSCVYIPDLSSTLQLKPGQKLVLCAGKTYTFKELIQFIQQNHTKFHYYFHTAGSHSIIGSSISTNSGEAIGIPDVKEQN